MARYLRVAVCLAAALPWIGCVGKAPLRGPEISPEQAEQTRRKESIAHLEGVWEHAGKSGKNRQMVFGSGGQLTFQGGLEFYNPGLWDLDSDHQELRITLPDADVDKLQVFQLYLHDGVKAFDPARKQITYQFDDQTWMLNIAGWEYTKAGKTSVQTEAEPVLK